jgi:hypothetical protein
VIPGVHRARHQAIGFERVERNSGLPLRNARDAVAQLVKTQAIRATWVQNAQHRPFVSNAAHDIAHFTAIEKFLILFVSHYVTPG